MMLAQTCIVCDYAMFMTLASYQKKENVVVFEMDFKNISKLIRT